MWGVHPTRRRVHGRTCVPTVADLPEPVDAVVVAIPAAGVPEVIEQAGARGCGGAVVYAAGFGETPDGQRLEAALRTAAHRHDLPVCGPNCDGIVAFHDRAALWGDALVPAEAGHVAVVSQSGNVAVNALAARRGLRLHTVVSCGNQAVVDAGDWLHALAQREGVRSVALFLESDGDGARLCEALALCADAGIGVAVLKVGASAAGASAAAAHTGAVAGDHAAFRALVQEAGAAWAARRPRAARAGQGARGPPRAPARRRRAGHPHLLGRRLGPRGRRGTAPRPRRCPRWRPRRPSACARCCRRRPPSPTRSTTRRSSGARSRRCAT